MSRFFAAIVPGKNSQKLGFRTRMMGLSGRERSLTIPLAIWIQHTNVTHRQTDRRTDGETDGHWPTAKQDA